MACSLHTYARMEILKNGFHIIDMLMRLDPQSVSLNMISKFLLNSIVDGNLWTRHVKARLVW